MLLGSILVTVLLGAAGVIGVLLLIQRDFRSKSADALKLLVLLTETDQTATMELREELHARNLQLNELSSNFELLVQEVRGETRKARAAEERARHMMKQTTEGEPDIEALEEWPPPATAEAGGPPVAQSVSSRLFAFRRSRRR